MACRIPGKAEARCDEVIVVFHRASFGPALPPRAFPVHGFDPNPGEYNKPLHGELITAGSVLNAAGLKTV